MAQSLFKACRNIINLKNTAIQNIGGHDINIEYYNQKSINDDVTKISRGEYTNCSFGNSNEDSIVLVADNTITIPSGYTLTPQSPKKSLVIFCNEFVNEGTISMTAKAPNVLPHDYYILGVANGYDENIVIPAYANNAVGSKTQNYNSFFNVTGIYCHGKDGNNGVNRQCGSGGTGTFACGRDQIVGMSGSGYAFGGGAGSGGVDGYNRTVSYTDFSVSEIYPMRGGSYVWINDHAYACNGGVGNPNGGYNASNSLPQNTGCGGRIIIFCNSFTNNGTIVSKGTDSRYSSATNEYAGFKAYGGASGGGAIDIFYNTLISSGTTSVSGGLASTMVDSRYIAGNGGNGSITFSEWNLNQIVKPQRKKFSQDNWTYLFSEYASRIGEEI